MSGHGPGKGKLFVSTTLPLRDYETLKELAIKGGWRSPTAYIRAILEHHAAQRIAFAERRTLYTIPPARVGKAAESGNERKGQP
jgi:hypothetical protein